MNVHIRRLREGEVEAVVRLSLAAWAPVFHSFEQVLGTEIFTRQYPNWQTGQRGVVEGACAEQAPPPSGLPRSGARSLGSSPSS